MKKMYGLLLVLGLGATESAWAALVYPIEIYNRSGKDLKVWLYNKTSKTPYSPNIASPRAIHIKDLGTGQFNIGSTDLVEATVEGDNINLNIDLVAPYAKYIIDKNLDKKGNITGAHVTKRDSKSNLKTGTPYNK